MKSLQLDPGELEYIDSRIRDVERAAERSRLVYIVSSLMSLLLFSVTYNQLISWSRAMAEALDTRINGFDETAWSDQLALQQMHEWIAGLQFDLPYLGGRFGVSDAGIVGGILLSLCTIWAYYAMRRENRTVYYLVKDIEEFHFSDNARFYARNQLFATQLFIEGRQSRPFNRRNIENDDYNRLSKRARARWIEWLKAHTPIIVFFMPAMTLMFVFAVDVVSLFENSPFRPGGEVLLFYICDGRLLTDCHQFAPVARRLLFSLGFVAVVYSGMRMAYMFQRGTTDLVHYTAKWKAPVLQHRKGVIAGINAGLPQDME